MPVILFVSQRNVFLQLICCSLHTRGLLSFSLYHPEVQVPRKPLLLAMSELCQSRGRSRSPRAESPSFAGDYLFDFEDVSARLLLISVGEGGKSTQRHSTSSFSFFLFGFKMRSRKKRSRRVLRSYTLAQPQRHFGRGGGRANLGKSRKKPGKTYYKHAYVDKVSEASDLDDLNAASLKRDLDYLDAEILNAASLKRDLDYLDAEILNAANIVPAIRDYSVRANSRPEMYVAMDDDDDEITDDIDPMYMQRRTRKRVKKQTRRRSRSRRIRRKRTRISN